MIIRIRGDASHVLDATPADTSAAGRGSLELRERGGCNAISKLEARDARLFRRLSNPAYHPTLVAH